MNRKVAVLAGFDPDSLAVWEAVRVVGITPEGAIPFQLDRPPGWRPTVKLPGLQGSHPLDAVPLIQRRLREEFGLDAGELIVMSRYGIPTGARGRATIVLAPRVRVLDAGGADLSLVALPDVTSWLDARKSEGCRVDLMVRVGLLLAERHFPRWAGSLLRAAIEELRRGETTTTRGSRRDLGPFRAPAPRYAH